MIFSKLNQVRLFSAIKEGQNQTPFLSFVFKQELLLNSAHNLLSQISYRAIFVVGHEDKALYHQRLLHIELWLKEKKHLQKQLD